MFSRWMFQIVSSLFSDSSRGKFWIPNPPGMPRPDTSTIPCDCLSDASKPIKRKALTSIHLDWRAIRSLHRLPLIGNRYTKLCDSGPIVTLNTQGDICSTSARESTCLISALMDNFETLTSSNSTVTRRDEVAGEWGAEA